jgi:DNA-damage-inducible protein J
MPTNAVVRARINKQVKKDAQAVLDSIGLTVSDAFRMMMRIATEKKLLFDPLIPNAETIEAMKAARREEVTTVGPIDDLLASPSLPNRLFLINICS